MHRGFGLSIYSTRVVWRGLVVGHTIFDVRAGALRLLYYYTNPSLVGLE
jgi:hypothetical protein